VAGQREEGEGAASNRASMLVRAGGRDNAESRVRATGHATGS